MLSAEFTATDAVLLALTALGNLLFIAVLIYFGLRQKRATDQKIWFVLLLVLGVSVVGWAIWIAMDS